ncbi:DUF2505 domain-containing protein [Nocardia stercoris]|uniref:DUF2505 domain-containing protein n=1 Tax=Nocardia stercoris TaxID=2483361 RepID=A0A3M2KZE0_9NOCA|nr:DUF2505 domain-containing protein [Nocardia stercoris]RMI30839.1 DUF2505 domain-containing protein [Nocardia stercoris]
MVRRLDYSARYPLRTSHELYATLADQDYWEARMAEMRKHSPNHLTAFSVSENGIRAEVRHVVPRDLLPDLARTVLRKDMEITRVENYGPEGAQVEGSYTATIPSAPGSLGGTMRLFTTETGCTLRYSSVAKVNIPFVNRSLEQLILVNLVELFRAEAEFTEQWLSERKPVGEPG